MRVHNFVLQVPSWKRKKKAMVELEGGRLQTEDISLAPYPTQNHPTPACLNPSVPHSRSSVVSLGQIPMRTVTEMALCSLLASLCFVE